MEMIKEKLQAAKKHTEVSGVYALLENDRVFYVGVSSRFGNRLLQHFSNYGYHIDFMLLEEFDY